MTTLVPHPAGVPIPKTSAHAQGFWEGIAAGELRYQRCRDCASITFPPQPMCIGCLSSAMEWVRSSGQGSVYSWTVIHRPQTPAFKVPYAVAIIDIDEGFQMISNVIGCEPDDLAIGMRVALEFHPIGDGQQLHYFRPV